MILLQLSQTGGETVIICSSQLTVSNRICAHRYKRWGGTGCTVRNLVFRTRGVVLHRGQHCRVLLIHWRETQGSLPPPESAIRCAVASCTVGRK